MEKNSYDRRTYESVDDGSLSWVTSQKWTEKKIQAVKGQYIVQSERKRNNNIDCGKKKSIYNKIYVSVNNLANDKILLSSY